MSKFVLKKLKRDDFSSVEKEISFNGLELTMQFKKDVHLERAMAIIHGQLAKPKLLSSDVLADRSEFDELESILFVIGEYSIKQWNVTDDGKDLEINGKNFLMLCDNIGEVKEISEFVGIVLATFNELSEKFKQQRESIKKKP